MLDFGDRKDLLFLLIIGILVVVAFLIFSLITIWKPSNNNNQFRVGDYNDTNITDDIIVSEYVNKISNLILNKDYDALYNYLSKDYIEHSGITKAKLKDKLDDLGILEQGLYIENFETNSFRPYNKLFFVTVKGNVANKSARMVIKEISPRNFEIAFDELVWYQKNVEVNAIENIMCNFTYIEYTTSGARFQINITNNNKYSIYLNNSAQGETFMLTCGANTNLSQSTTETRGSKIEIKPGETKMYILTYRLDGTKISDITGITIKDVNFSNGNVKNMLFYID